MANLDRHIEFESKYRVDAESRIAIKLTMEKIEGFKNFLYVEGPDTYFTDKDNDFLRYRRPNFSNDSRAELTMKKKKEDAKNNIIRQEWNLRVDNTPEHTVIEMISNLGFSLNFSIYKSCDIYFFEDATLVYYSVVDTTDGKLKKLDHFVEIEVKEENIHELTEDQAWAVIEKYEKALSDVGISAQKRLKKSLFDMYRRE